MRPSVKRLRERRKKLDAVLKKVKDSIQLSSEELTLYEEHLENKRKWNVRRK